MDAAILVFGYSNMVRPFSFSMKCFTYRPLDLLLAGSMRRSTLSYTSSKRDNQANLVDDQYTSTAEKIPIIAPTAISTG